MRTKDDLLATTAGDVAFRAYERQRTIALAMAVLENAAETAIGATLVMVDGEIVYLPRSPKSGVRQ